jgi:hypothetical protein
MSASDLPWDELLVQADELIGAGATLHQKFTCAFCGARQTMETPNVFYIEGECEECAHVTDIRQRGCGYLATFHIRSPDHG